MHKYTKEQLIKTIADQRIVFPNSTSSEKAAGLQMIFDEALGQGSVAVEVIRALAASYVETDLPDAEEVATQKSIHFQDKLGRDKVTAGADTVFRINQGDSWQNLSKLERLGRELTAQETMAQYESLFNVLLIFDNTCSIESKCHA